MIPESQLQGAEVPSTNSLRHSGPTNLPEIQAIKNPPTPSAVERVRTTFLCPTLNPANLGRIHVLPRPFCTQTPAHSSSLQLTPAHSGRIHDLLKSQKSQKWLDFDKNGTPEALDERNQYSGTSRSHWEGSRTLEKAPNPKNCSPDPKNWGRWHGEAFK